MSKLYRHVSDDEISPYIGVCDPSSPQAKNAQDRKRADVRRRERPTPPQEDSDLIEILTAVAFVVAMAGMFIITLASV